MGKFTEEQLARMAPGLSPKELADLNLEDGEWERKGAELRAAHAQTAHELEMVKAEGLNAINSVQYDSEVAAEARVIHNQSPSGPSVSAIIERVIIPIREKFLATFETQTPVTAPHKAGPNEKAFNKLVGSNNG